MKSDDLRVTTDSGQPCADSGADDSFLRNRGDRRFETSSRESVATTRRPKTQAETQLFGGQRELEWLRRVVDADSARLSLLRAENARLRREIEELRHA